jgi:hypothetical protein
VEQLALFAYHNEELVFVIDDDDTPERCWSAEQSGLCRAAGRGMEDRRRPRKAGARYRVPGYYLTTSLKGGVNTVLRSTTG